MIRSQEEILERFLKVEDVFNAQKSDLSNFLQFDTCKHLLDPQVVKDIENGVGPAWTLYTDAKEQILNYLPFAYEKARNQRGLSSARSLLHMKAWTWLDDEDFHQEICKLIEQEGSNDSQDYGISILDKISEKYGYVEV